jgi:hypothetical protein
VERKGESKYSIKVKMKDEKKIENERCKAKYKKEQKWRRV